MLPRTDQRTAALITMALFYRQMLGQRYAAALLARHCVPLPMARRVLTTRRRRNPPTLVAKDQPPFLSGVDLQRPCS